MQNIAQHSLVMWGEGQQSRYLDAIERGLLLLLAHPDLGRAREGLPPGTRVYRIEQHLAVYDVRGGTLRVLRLLHHRQDFRRTLRSTP